MPPRATPHDPFTDAPLRPTTSNSTNPALRSQASHSSLRSASSRTRGGGAGAQPSLFAPALSRRPTGRSTPRVDHDQILADSDSEAENEASVSRPQQQQRQVRRAGVRDGGSPEMKGGRAGTGTGNGREKVGVEEVEIVNRRPDGGYLLGLPGVGETVAVPQVAVPKTEDEMEQEEVDAHYGSISRQFFASGSALGGRSSKKHEEELEQLRLPMMLRLREQVTEKLEGERWQFESVERYQPLI